MEGANLARFAMDPARIIIMVLFDYNSTASGKAYIFGLCNVD